MEIAVIKTGGKQYKVSVGETIKVEKLGKETKLQFEDLLGGKKVTASVVGQGTHSKIRVLKFRPKKRYKRVNGHVQKFSSLKIESIK